MRQFISEKKPDNNGILILNGKDFRYFRQVLRARAGDMINVRLPDGKLQNMTLCRIDDSAKTLELQICGETETLADSSITRGVQAAEIDGNVVSGGFMNGKRWYLFQFMPRPQKFELIVKAATECGVYRIIPVAGQYSEKSSLQTVTAKKERFDKIIREARQQSGSPVDTQIEEPMTVEEACDYWNKVSAPENKTAFVLSERSENCAPFPGNLIEENVTNVAIAVGSEGGISPEEVEILEQGLFGRLHFSVNILRCETAALYGIAAVQSACMKN